MSMSITFKARPYQKEVIQKTLQKLSKLRSVMIVMATGSGKTPTFGEIVRRCQLKGYRVLVVAHRKELILQAQEELFNMFGVRSGVIMGNHKSDYNIPVQIGSVQTLTRRTMPKNIKVIVIDEGHHMPASSYVTIINHYPNAKIIPVTATPWRLNGEGFDHLVDDMVQGPSIRELEEMGYLCPARIFPTPIEEDLTKEVGLSKGDYKQKALSKFMQDDQKIADGIATIKKHVPTKQGVVFCVDINHALKVEKKYRAAGISCRAITSKSGNTRDQDVKDFRAGKYQCFINVGVATEGTNFKFIEFVQCFRPTKSLSLWCQMTGRGSRLFTRPDGSKKTFYYLFDHTNNFYTHGAPNADREWSLKPWKKKGQKVIEQVRSFKLADDPDGEIYRADELPLEFRGKELIEIRGGHNTKMFDTFLKAAKDANHKLASAYFRYLEYLKDYEGRKPTEKELIYIAKRLNYKTGWAKYQQLK